MYISLLASYDAIADDMQLLPQIKKKSKRIMRRNAVLNDSACLAIELLSWEILPK
jgi:hypothetical protein